MSAKRARSRGTLLNVSLLFLVPLMLRAEEARVVPAEMPAAGRHAAAVDIPRFGRWALTAESKDGVALTVVDRMGGPGARTGVRGEEDGRADVFLDRGQIRVVLNGDSKSKGRVKLSAREFVERNGDAPLRLVETKSVATTLADFEKRSWWISVEERRRVAIEAAGRSLADIRLWRDGSWLVAAEPETEVTTPRAGRPLRVLRLSAELEPGLYLLSAYGSPGEPWAEESTDHPLSVIWGFPSYGAAGRARHEIGASGIDRYLIGGAATFVGLEVPEARPIWFNVAPWDEAQPFHEGAESGSIDKKTNPPATSLRVAAKADGRSLVTVRGVAGQPYVLTHFELRDSYPVRGGGEWWIGSIPSSDSRDAVDATGVLVESGTRTPLEGAEVLVSPGRPWAGRGNLDGPLSLFFRTTTAGSYTVEAAGVDARMQILPALAPRSDKVRPVALRGKGPVDLDTGLWELSVRPEKKGIVTLSIRAGNEPAPAPKAPRGGVLFPKVALSGTASYTLFVGKRPGVASGLVFRKLPLDLRDPLAIAASPGEALHVPFALEEEATLEAETEDGTALAVAVDGNPAATRPRVAAGVHEAVVTLAGDAPRVLSLAARPRSLAKDVPLPQLPEGSLAALPQFPELVAGTPQTLDLAQGESATFRLRVPTPALYRVETTGLLAMNALLRTRTVTRFRSEGENGTGRNALLADFLREGDYQVTVNPRGSSAGHLGVVLEKTSVAKGGIVTDGVPARLSLAAGEAAEYVLDITRSGSYRIRAFGLNKKLAVRLEDKDGWPLLKPGVDGDIQRTLEKGTYRLVVLPLSVPTRAVVSLDRKSAPPRFRGHGPHPLPLGRKGDALWMESKEGEARVPDRFTFTLPAPAETLVTLTAGMEGRLTTPGSAPVEVRASSSTSGFHVPLAAGPWVLEVVASRRDSNLEYSVTASPEPLVAGLARAVTAPADVAVSIGSAGLYALESTGMEDVRARLRDAAGNVVASNDDRADDWNFAITRPLSPGRYTLRVEPTGTPTAKTSVALRMLPTAALAPGQPPVAPLPIARELRPGRGVVEIPVTVPAQSMLSVSASAAESVGLSISDEEGTPLAQDAGRTAQVFLPVAGTRTLRIGLYSADGRGGAVKLGASSAALAEWSERDLEKGGPLPNGAVAVRLERPGVFRLEGAAARVSTADGTQALPVEGAVAAAGTRMVVVSDGPVRGARMRLDEKETTLSGAAASVDLAQAMGPILVLARSATGQPGLLIAHGAATAGERTALAAALESPQAVALTGGPGDPLSDVVLSRLSFANPRVETPNALSFDGAVGTRGARAFDLPAGTKRLRVALGPGLVALVSKGREAVALAAASEETLETDGDRITFLSTSPSETRFALDVFAVPGLQPALAPRVPFAASLPDAGTLRIPVAAPLSGETRRLHVRGSSEAVTLLSAEGKNLRGFDLDVPAGGGTLLIPHAPGLILAWVDRAGSEAADLFGNLSETAPVALRPPAAVALSGDVAAFSVAAGSPSLLSLRASGPALSLVLRDGAAPDVAIHRAGVSLDVYAPSGSVRILLRSFAGGTLSGRATLTSTPVTKISEGLGPETLLGAGQARLYGFHVARTGPVGLGVRASSDLVGATLLSSAGARLGEGLVQMPELAEGDYLLAVRTPAEVPPIRIRPALAGVAPPGTGPPADVIRAYVHPESAGTTTSARARAEREESDEAGDGSMDTETASDTENPERGDDLR